MKDRQIIKIAKLIFIFLILINSNIRAQNQNKEREKIKLKINLSRSSFKDTITVYVGNDMFFNLYSPGTSNESKKYIQTRDSSGIYVFDIPVDKSSGYFYLIKNRRTPVNFNSKNISIIKPQYWEVGDSLEINIDFNESQLGGNGFCRYYGRGSSKYNLNNFFFHNKINNTKADKLISIWPQNWDGNILTYNSFDSLTPITKANLKVLEMSKNKISDKSYWTLKANLIYRYNSGTLNKIREFIKNGGISEMDSIQKNLFINRFNHSFEYSDQYKLEQRYLTNSLFYLSHLSNKFHAFSVIANGFYSPEYIYDKIKYSRLDFETKEILIMNLLLRGKVTPKNLSLILSDAEIYIKNPNYLRHLEDLKLRLPGKKFSNFELEDNIGELQTLNKYIGKVVVIDFWFTGCGYCQQFFENTLSKAEEKLKDNKDVIFLSISVDRNKLKWKKSVESGLYSSKTSVNLFTNGLGFHHPLIRTNNIQGYPTIILLNKSGFINYFNTDNLKNERELLLSIRELLAKNE